MLGLVVTINGNAMPVASRLATFGPATKPQFLKNLNRQRVLSKEINAKKCSSECPYECGALWARIYSEAPSTISTFNKKWIDCNRNPGSTGAHFGHIGKYQIWKFLRFGGSVATSLAGAVYMDWVPDGWSVDNLKNRIPTGELGGWMQSSQEKYLTTFILTSFPSALPRAFISLKRAYLLREMISIFNSADMSKKYSVKARRTWTVPEHHHDGVEPSASFVISQAVFVKPKSEMRSPHLVALVGKIEKGLSVIATGDGLLWADHCRKTYQCIIGSGHSLLSTGKYGKPW